MGVVFILMYVAGALFIAFAATTQRGAIDLETRVRLFAAGMFCWIMVALFRAAGLLP